MILYKYIIIELELQNLIWFSLLKLNNDPFNSKEHILFIYISKPIWVIFVALNVLSVELQNIFEAQK